MSGNLDSELFQALVIQLAQAGWMALGKIPNPVSGKIERHLESARLTIDMLGALETRTRGNLAPEEKSLLERSLRELRLNYVDEVRKAPASPAAAEGDETASASPPAPEAAPAPPGVSAASPAPPAPESPPASTAG